MQLHELLPKWSRYIPHEPTVKQLAFLMLQHEEAMFGGALGGGKGLPPETPVITPWGPKPIGQLRIGSKVCATDGTVTQVINKWDRGVQPRYKLIWHNGEETICDEDHIWLAWITGKSRKQNNQRTHGESSARKWTTKEIYEKFHTLNELSGSHRFAIPVISNPVAYNVHGENRGPTLHIDRSLISPYVLGVILGDGWSNSSSTSFCSADQQIVDEVSKELGRECVATKSPGKCKPYRITECREALILLGLHNKRSWEKFIPRIYKYGSIEERWALIQGLMDTDGWADQDGDCYFTSTSKQLRDDISEVARSLGAITFHREGFKYYSNNGKRKQSRKAYTVRIKITNSSRLFRLDRKKELAKECPQSMALYLQSIERIEDGPTVCIQVAHKNSLFITGNFVVTHNSDVLLMAGLQYMDTPGFAGIIFRRSLSDLKLPGALLDRIQKWLAPFLARKEVKYVPSEHTYYFPTTWPDGSPGDPAKLAFGYIGDSTVHERYQSAEFQYIAFDELTSWDSSEDYSFMFSRLRQAVCTIHKTDSDGKPNWVDGCMYCDVLRQVPKRMRSATNPGGSGGTWVKNWFSIKPDPEKYPTRKDALQALQRGDIVRFVGTDPTKAFIPSFLEDNPFLDRESYDKMLTRLSDADQDRLRSGNWEFRPDSRFKRAWIKYYTFDVDRLILPHKIIHLRELKRIYCTVDSAATVREGPIDTQVRKGAPSWTVISTWGLTVDNRLIYLDMVRFQKEIPDVVEAIGKAYEKWNHDYVKIEYQGTGIGVAQFVELLGVPVIRCEKRIDKLENSTTAMMLMKNGRIYFPDNLPWIEIAEDEIFGWTGLPGTEDDIIDTLSDAANDVALSEGVQALPRAVQQASGPVHKFVPISSITGKLGSRTNTFPWNK